MTSAHRLFQRLIANERKRESERQAGEILWRQFGEAVRSERKRKRIRLNLFAGELGVSPAMVSYMESGKRNWGIGMARKAVLILSR